MLGIIIWIAVIIVALVATVMLYKHVIATLAQAVGA